MCLKFLSLTILISDHKKYILMKQLVATLIICASFISAYAQERLSVMDALSTSLESNYQISIRRLTVTEAELMNTWGMAGRYPTVTLGSIASYVSGKDSIVINQKKVSVSLETSLTLFDGFSVNYRKSNLALSANSASTSLSILLETTVQSVILAYNSVIYFRNKLELTNQLEALSRDRLNFVLAAKEIGTSGRFDELQAKTAYLEDKSSVLAAKNAFVNSKRQLAYLMGANLENDFLVADSFVVERSEYRLADLKQRMLSSNFTLKNQSIALQLAKNDIGLAQSEFMPTIAAVGSVSSNRKWVERKGFSFPMVTTNDAYGALSLSYKLYGGGRNRRNLQIAKLSETITEINYADTEQLLLKELLSAFDLYKVKVEMLDVATENSKLASLNLEMSKAMFESGAITSFNYRDIQLLYARAVDMALQAKYELIDAQLILVRLTGGMLAEYQLK